MRFGITAAAAVMAAISAAGTANAAWLKASSEHFVIYADDTEKDITRLSQDLERYHAAMAFALGSNSSAPSPSNRVTVYVVRNQKEVRGLYPGDNKYIGGFYIPRAGGSLAIVPSVQTGNGPITLSMITILHEYAHHFLISASSMPLPRWLSEGAAEFFASAQFDPDGSVWVGRAAQHRAGELLYERDVKVADLLDPAEYEKRKSNGYDAFYGKSWLLYHYLTFEPSRKGQFARYLSLLGQGKGQRLAATEAFGDFGALERDVTRYLAKGRILALNMKPERLKIGPVSVRPISMGEAAMMLVSIRSKRGVGAEEAASLLTEARAVAARYPDDAGVLAALAECEVDAGNLKEAIAAADGAIKRDPSQVNAYVQKGLALFEMADTMTGDRAAAYKAARMPFIALNKIENDHPLPLLFFYRSFVEQGQQPPQLALDGLIRAAELAPFDHGLRMTLADALIRQGRLTDARVVLAPVAANPHGGALARHATRMIEKMDLDPNWRGGGIPSDDDVANDDAEAA